MTDSPFAFQDEDGHGTVEQVDEESGGKRRTLIGVGALVALALAGGAFLLVGGDEPTEEVAFPSKRTPKVQAPAVPVAPDATVTPVGDAASIGTNPFKALYVEPVAAPAPAAPVAKPPPPAAPPVVLVTTSQNAAGTTTTKVATSPAPVAPAPAPAAAPVPKPVPVTRTVTLKSVATDSGANVGTFVLNGETFMGAKGAVLGGKALVKELVKNTDGVWVATLQVGDGTPFDVYLGQEVVIQ